MSRLIVTLGQRIGAPLWSFFIEPLRYIPYTPFPPLHEVRAPLSYSIEVAFIGIDSPEGTSPEGTGQRRHP